MIGKPWRVLAPLLNFTAESQGPIPIFDNIEIRRLTLEDQGGDDPNSMFRFMTQQTQDIPSGLPSTWAIAGEFVQPWQSTVIQVHSTQERFGRVVEALHLLHDEMADFPFVIFGEASRPVYHMGSRSNPFPSLLAWQRALGRPYVLQPVEYVRLKELAGEMDRRVAIDSAGALGIAIGRMNATHLRFVDADRIIDSAICLEAILLKGVESELSYRQAIRGAHLLGGSDSERLDTFRFLRKAYDRRSKIVHGATDPGVPSTDQILTIARRVVLAFVEATRQTPHQSLIERLDSDAVRGPGMGSSSG